MNILAFQKAIAAVCPILGVDSDRNISFDPSATAPQIAAAQALAASWVDPGDALTQAASAALAAGIAITSTGNSALNATYPCDPSTQAQLTTLFALVTAGVVSSPILVADITGTVHTFDNTQFTNFVGAVLKYGTLLNIIAATNSGSLPTASATIP